MPESLTAYLKHRAERSLVYLLREAEAVGEVDAFRGRRADWPDQPWGIGQDGSIAGIVYHVAAWKQLALPMFARNGKPRAARNSIPRRRPTRTIGRRSVRGWHTSAGNGTRRSMPCRWRNSIRRGTGTAKSG